jgi:hypothetical protein
MKGFRQQPEAGRKERLRALEKEVENLSMAVRINQMMTQQILQNLKGMKEDLGNSLGLINELQYKILAVQRVSSLDLQALADVANELRLKDFNEASDKEDAEGKYTVGTVVDERSTVILTSKTEDPDKGIFRSRLKLSECGVPDLIKAFMGREAGAKALVKLNGVDHEVELLAIRQPPVVAQAAGDGQPTTVTLSPDSPTIQVAEVAGNA